MWVLALMVALGSSLCLLGALRPALPESPTTVNAIGAAVGPVLIAVLWWPRTRVRALRTHVVAVTLLVTAYLLVATAATGEGAMAVAMVTIWMGLYSAAFHPRPVARAYLLGCSLALGVALASNPVIRAGWASWVVLVVSTVAASEIYAQLLDRARQLAVTDHLTGLPNREGLYQRIERELRLARRHERPLTLAVIDLDGFKQINDREGHLAGDRMLRSLADQLTTRMRTTDALFRTGGDEFLLLLPGASLQLAARIVQRLHEESEMVWSYGLACVEPGEGLDAALARADREMYAHKRALRATALTPSGRAGETRTRLVG